MAVVDAPMTLEDIQKAHPLPWNYTISGNQITVLDANSGQVQLFTLLAFMQQITRKIATLKEKQ